MENISGIYKIQSLIKPDRIYIGSAISINNRWDRHLLDLKNNKHHSKKLQRHYNKYGKNDLIFSIVVLCEKEDLLKIEQGYLDQLSPFFNTYKTAGSPLGYKHSAESNYKKGNAFRGKKQTAEHIKNRTSKLIGKKNGLGNKSHTGMTAWNKGLKGVYKASDETKKKLSNMRKGKPTWNKGLKTGKRNK